MSASVELAIRGGTVVDGTGRAGERADIGIAEGRIVAMAPTVRGERELDAAGRLVTPGFVDIHTHYDPQVLWDPALTPSSWHGVTSVVAGSCGFSIAPTRPEGRATLLRTLDKVEDMRLATLEAGVEWDFDSYGTYLAAVERRGLLVNFGGYVGHTPVRLFVMGEAAYERPATDDEIAEMRRVVAESIRAGAIGVSTDRAGFHLADGGRPVPSIVATQAETEALLGVVADIGQGVVHIAPGENYEWVFDFQRRLGRTVNYSSILVYPESSARKSHRDKLAMLQRARAEGGDVWAQVTCRPISQQVTMSEPTSFYVMGSFSDFVARDDEGRIALLADPAWRDRVQDDIDGLGLLGTRWDTMTVEHSASRADLVGRSIGQIAREQGASPWATLCDLAVADRLETRVEITFANDDADEVAHLLASEGCVLGLSDAGAHVTQICDAVQPTDFLGRWVRDRGVMSVEAGVRKLTGELADLCHLDRGYLRVGAPADVAVVDLAAVGPGPTRRVRDMPAGGERLIADRPTGVDHVVVNGVEIRRDGEPVPAALDRAPGRLLRSTPG